MFADRILACYVIGSHVDGTAVSKSDIDLVVVFKDHAHEDEKQTLEEACKALSSELSTNIDLEILNEESLAERSDPMLKLGSSLLFGLDIRDDLPTTTIEDWARDRLHTSYWRATKLFNRPTRVTLPLNYPSLDDPFFGYVVSGNTRNLLRHVSWAATALIAYQGRAIVIRKSDFCRVYRAVINDDFSDYLENLYQKCKLEWNYQVPENDTELRELCGQTLAFENHFMKIYRPFLLSELQSAPLSAQITATWMQTQLPLIDPEVKTALANFVNHPSAELRANAIKALDDG
jgi:predicted nucleotidyltransferase